MPRWPLPVAVPLILLLAACAGAPASRAPAPRETVPPVDASTPLALHIVQAAEAVIGAPYRFGGGTEAGFDCSGLTQYAHRAAGLEIPRTAADQQRASIAVRRSALRPGDLVFFAIGRHGVDHVGVYAGDGRFVHAPATGRVVSFAYLEDPWYAKRFVGAGRFWSTTATTTAGPGHPSR